MPSTLAANVTDDTKDIINEIFSSPDFMKFRLKSKLNLSDKTILIRFALINLAKNIPSSDEVLKYKAALLRPGEFDDYLKDLIPLEITQ